MPVIKTKCVITVCPYNNYSFLHLSILFMAQKGRLMCTDLLSFIKAVFTERKPKPPTVYLLFN